MGLNDAATFRRSVQRRLLRARTARIQARDRGDLCAYREAKAEIAEAARWLDCAAGIDGGAA